VNYESDYGGVEEATAGPADWVEYPDEATGEPYWYSESTAESSYERPAASSAASRLVAGGKHTSIQIRFARLNFLLSPQQGRKGAN
jgi:hypothetical protein